MSALLRTLLPSAIGGAVVAVAMLAFGLGGSRHTTTVIQQAPLRTAADSAPRGLTARDIYKRDAPGVVYVRATVVSRTQSPFDLFPLEQQSEATGSGFVIDRVGDILTNAHVVSGASKVKVSFESKQTLRAQVVGSDLSNDLALLRVDGSELRPLALGDSSTVQVGDPAIAIGNPFGFERTLTTGVISALQRQITAPNDFRIDNVIQTDAPINPGNSGGPLLDAAGRVIGINSQIATGGNGGGFVGIGFAVPINTAKQVLPELRRGDVKRGFLGISGATIDPSLARLNLAIRRGVLVQQVTPGSPADRAGIRGGSDSVQTDNGPVLLGGDVITAVAHRRVRTMGDVANAVADRKPGERVGVELLREGHRHDVSVTLAARPLQTSDGG